MEQIVNVESFAWMIWLGLVLLFVIIEMLNLEFTFLMMALGGVGGLVAGLLGLPLWAQIVVAAALSVVLLFVVRPSLLRALRKDADPAKSNIAALLGISGLAVLPVTAIGGQVKLSNGDIWTARLDPAVSETIPESGAVIVTAIDGATAVVAPRPS